MKMITSQFQELKIVYIKMYVGILFFIYSINTIIHFFYCSSVFYINFLSMVFFLTIFFLLRIIYYYLLLEKIDYYSGFLVVQFYLVLLCYSIYDFSFIFLLLPPGILAIFYVYGFKKSLMILILILSYIPLGEYIKSKYNIIPPL